MYTYNAEIFACIILLSDIITADIQAWEKCTIGLIH